MSEDETLRCPVCRACFRGQRECSRCGADLTPLMQLAAQAYQLRQAARKALHLGDFSGSRRFASAAQDLYHTPAGRDLDLLTSWLAALP